MSELHQLYVHAACGRGSVLLCLRRNTLSTSGFVDDVTMARNVYDNGYTEIV